MGVGSEGQGGRGPPDFHTWYRYSRERLNSAMFRSFIAIFQTFSVGLLEIFMPMPLCGCALWIPWRILKLFCLNYFLLFCLNF